MDWAIEQAGPLAPGRDRAEARWGDALRPGFTILPDVLLKNLGALGLSFREAGVLFQLISFWWTVETWPRPRISTLAKRLGIDERTVQRSIADLAAKGLVTRVRVKTQQGDFAQGFDLSGLVGKLEALARREMQLKGQQRENGIFDMS